MRRMAGQFLYVVVTNSLQILALMFYDKMKHDSNKNEKNMMMKKKKINEETKRNVT